MLKRGRLVVLGVLMAGILSYVCTGINATPALAGEACQKAAQPCCPGENGSPCDLAKELGLTAEQIAKIEKLKAEREKDGNKCTPEECFQKIKELLTKEQSEKLDVLIAKKNGGNAPVLIKGEDAPNTK